MRISHSILLFTASATLAGCAKSEPGDSADSAAMTAFQDDAVNEDKVIMPLNNGGSADTSGQRTANISYHNGPVMTGGVNIYYIWYGNWASNTATSILPDLASSIGGSSYWNINTSYYSQDSRRVKTYIPNTVNYSGSTTVAYPYGTSISDASVLQVVRDAIGTGTPDANAIYFVLTSSDVAESSGFCTSYCGWHSHATVNGVDTKYSFVGNPDRCLSSCAAQSTSPNSNAGADGMASIIAHEAEEAATDPDINAWYDSRGSENADKCAWTWGTTSTASNGSRYNMTLGTRNYLIQQNWSASTQACGLR
jgi:hypothetical protein